ncbi:MAG TPA: restriction endonuclease subunit S [Methanoregulaceae archaeon]|nr:restriction endonuclease subunit S [Methanoregulaceae archaeon]
MTITASENEAYIPQGWHCRYLGNLEFFNLIMGQSPSSNNYSEEKIGLPFLQGNADFGLMYPVPKIYCKEPLKIAEKDDVLISVRAPVGEVNIASERYCIGRGLGAIRPKDKNDSKFLYYYLTHYRHEFETKSAGSTFKAIVKNDLEKFPVLFPPSEEKQRISTILTTIDDAIQRSRQVVAETERFKAGVMHELMTNGIGHKGFREDPDVGRMPKEWNVKPLDELIEIIDCKHYTPTYVENGFPIVRPQNIGIDGIDFVSCANVSRQEFLLMNEKHSPKRGDIVYSRNASFGIPAYVDESREFCIGQDMVVMTESTADTKYIFFVLCSNNIQQQLKQQSGGSTIQRINLKDIRRLLIPEPSKVEQQQIANILTTLDHKITLQRQRTAHYEKLKKGLMNELLTGKRRVAVT